MSEEIIEIRTADGLLYRAEDGGRGARHGWTVPDSAVYNPPQAERAFTKLTEMLSETLRAR